MRELYLYDATSIYRFISDDEKKLLGKDTNLMSYYDTFKARDKRFHVEDRFEPEIPFYIAIEKKDDVFYEFYSQKPLVDLTDLNYINGIITDLNRFLDSKLLIDEVNLDRLFKDYEPAVLKSNFALFSKIASREYVKLMQQKDIDELKETERIGKAMIKRMTTENR